MIKLKPFQKTGVKKIERFKGTILMADDMRLGKTVQTLKWVSNHRDLLPVVIVCPAIAKWEWSDQAMDHYGIPTVILEGTTPDKKILNRNTIYIINYDILWAWVSRLKRLRPEIVIMDEVHYIKNPKSRRSKACRRLTKGYIYKEDVKERKRILTKIKTKSKRKVEARLKKRVKHIIAISGTPLVSRPAELYPTLNILWPKVFRSFTDFGMEYCNPTFDRGKIVFKGATNLDKLHLKLKRLGMVRRLKKDVIKDYKEPESEVIALDFANPKEYKKKSVRLLQKLERHSKLEKHGGFMQLKQLAAEMKIDSVLKWIDDFLERSDEKIVIFAHHQKIIRAIKKHYPTTSVTIDGSISHKNRNAAKKLFANDKKIRVFIGNMQACGMAISLKAANTIAFAELPLTPGDLHQCKDRIFDLSKKDPLFVFYLIAKGTIEEVICRLLQRKQSIINEVMDGKNGVELNLFDDLEKKLMPNKTKRRVSNNNTKRTKQQTGSR